jgi:membrane protease YdiL (CAAX protease family)
MLPVLLLAINLLLLTATFASAALWIGLLRDRRESRSGRLLESIVPVSPRPRPFWRAADALVMLGSGLLITQAVVLWMISRGWLQLPVDDAEAEPLAASSLLAMIAASSIGNVGSLLITLLWLGRFDRDPRRKIGLTFHAADLGAGLRASLLLLPPVLLISAAASLIVPYEHPVLESLAGIKTPVIFLATFLATAVITPVVEEFLFRGLLQGGLQALADRIPSASPQSAEPTAPPESYRPSAWWPVLVASLVFALMHLGQGAAPIPLYFLGLGLGYLYRQTGSLAQPIIAHVVLNGLTLITEAAR